MGFAAEAKRIESDRLRCDDWSDTSGGSGRVFQGEWKERADFDGDDLNVPTFSFSLYLSHLFFSLSLCRILLILSSLSLTASQGLGIIGLP